jgi:hypothetical protein
MKSTIIFFLLALYGNLIVQPDAKNSTFNPNVIGFWNVATITILMPGGSTAKTWVTGLFAGWYLSSIDKLSILWHNRFHVNKTARAINSTLFTNISSYWSSAELDDSRSWYFSFSSGISSNTIKGNLLYVRAVRAF